MLADLLIPADAALGFLAASLTPDGVSVDLATVATAVPCSSCRVAAHRVHSRYLRTLADLPLAQRPVRIQLHTRRFFCDNPACSRRTFSEIVPGVIRPFARRTVRLASEQRRLGLDVGGEVGARTACRQGMPLSPDTVLRLIRRAPPAERPTPRHLGVDDFALLKGQKYGTILVDLDERRPVDLLPDRSAATFEQWLNQHPGVDLIARDRASEYAAAAMASAPQAIQTADRFHLLMNTREMLQRLLERQQAVLRAATKAAAPPETTELARAEVGIVEASPPTPLVNQATTPAECVAPPGAERMTVAQQGDHFIPGARQPKAALASSVVLVRT